MDGTRFFPLTIKTISESVEETFKLALQYYILTAENNCVDLNFFLSFSSFKIFNIDNRKTTKPSGRNMRAAVYDNSSPVSFIRVGKNQPTPDCHRFEPLRNDLQSPYKLTIFTCLSDLITNLLSSIICRSVATRNVCRSTGSQWS